MKILEAQDLAITLMSDHGLFDQGWHFNWDKASRRFGCTMFSTKTISLSHALTLLNDEVHVKNTILHEIAHALVGPRNHHNKVWKSKAVEVGCTPSPYYSQAVVKPEPKYKGVCPNGHTMTAMRRRSVACGTCCRQYNNSRFSPAYMVVWSTA